MSFFTQKKRMGGFTLIELLVVIAIIGMLSSIILASLNTARNKAKDAAAKEDLVNIRPQAQLFYDNNINYTGLCGNQTIINMFQAASLASTGVNSNYVCNAGGASGNQQAYAIQVQLSAGAGNYWCVDWTGASKFENAALVGTSCP